MSAIDAKTLVRNLVNATLKCGEDNQDPYTTNKKLARHEAEQRLAEGNLLNYIERLEQKAGIK